MPGLGTKTVFPLFFLPESKWGQVFQRQAKPWPACAHRSCWASTWCPQAPLEQSQAVPPGLPLPLLLQCKLSQIKNKSNLLEHKQPALIYFKHQDLLKLNKVQFNPISPTGHWFLLPGIPDSHRPNIPSLILLFADERITNFVFWQVAGLNQTITAVTRAAPSLQFQDYQSFGEPKKPLKSTS